MKLKFKKTHPDAKVPERANNDNGNAGLDLFAVSEVIEQNTKGSFVTYDTGIAIKIPDDHVGLLFPRSSVSVHTSLMLSNCVGVIDSNYTGSILVKFRNVIFAGGSKYNVGDKIAQLVIVPVLTPELQEVKDFTPTKRGSKGFGSTGV